MSGRRVEIAETAWFDGLLRFGFGFSLGFSLGLGFVDG